MTQLSEHSIMDACISLQYLTAHCLYFNWSHYTIVIFTYVQANPKIAPQYRATPSHLVPMTVCEQKFPNIQEYTNKCTLLQYKVF